MRISWKPMLAAAALTLALSACGGGGGSSTTPTPTPPAGGAAFTVTVIDTNTQKAVSGAKVVIDATGTPKTVDASGKASFTGLSAGAHDVHVFASGYVWASALGIDTAATTTLTVALEPVTPPTSNVVFRAGVANLTTGNFTNAYFIVNGVTYPRPGTTPATATTPVGTDAAGNPIYEWVIPVPFPAGTSLTGALKIAEYAPNIARTGSYLVDYKDMGSQTITTIATGATITSINVSGAPVALAATKPATSTLVTISSVASPNAATATTTTLSVHPGASGLGDAGLATEGVTQAGTYIGYDYSASTKVLVGATNTDANSTWIGVITPTKGGAASITNSITGLPLPNGGTGAGMSITWTKATGTFDMQVLTILNGATKAWTIAAPAAAGSVSLPTPPAGVGSNVVAGTAYNLQMAAINAPTKTYAQLLATPYIGQPGDLTIPVEVYQSDATQATWTP